MRLLIAAAVAVSLLLASVAGPASAQAAPGQLRTGISFVESSDPAAMQDVAAAGARFVQTPLNWPWVAPEQQPAIWDPSNPADPHYDWGWLDDWVRSATAAGLTPVLQIRDAPTWAQRCTPTGFAICNPDPTALAAFATAAARRYSGSFEGLPRVRYWQGLNEPNLSLFLEPQYEGDKIVSPGLYRVLINRFYAAIKSAVPSDLVLAAGLGPIAVPGYTIGPMQFTRKLLCMGGGRNPKPTAGSCEGGVHFDVFDIHPYTTGSPSHEGGRNDVEMGDLGKLQSLLRAADRAGRIKNSAQGQTPLWITEFAYDSKPPDPGGLAMKTESQWIPEALHEAWSAGVTHFFWYSLADQKPEPERPSSETYQSGLYFWNADVAQQQPKPAMYAFRFPFLAIRKGDGLDYWGRTPSSRGGRVVLEARRGGGWRKLGTARASAAGIFRGHLRGGYGRDRKGAVRARFGRGTSPGFPMRRVGDFPQPPFG